MKLGMNMLLTLIGEQELARRVFGNKPGWFAM